MKKEKKRIVDSKPLWIAVSLIASLVLWVYVTSIEQDEYKQTFRGVRVEIAGESVLKDSKQMTVSDLSTNTVNIEVVGPRRVIAALSSDDLTALVDVSKLSRASYTNMTYTVNYPNGTDTSGLQITKKIPDSISFVVSKLTEKTIPVRGSFEGNIAENFSAEAPVFEPSTITITGPEQYVKDISYAWVSFGADNDDVSSTYSVETGYTLMNAKDQEADTDGIECSTDIVEAKMPILMVKELPLDISLINGAGASSDNTVVSIEPAVITVSGDSSMLEAINKIPLGAIDLSSFTSTFTEVFPIPLDNSINNLSGETEAEVTIEIIGLETKVFRVSNIEVANTTEGYSSEVENNNIEVTIRGTAEQLEQITPNMIRIVADLEDYVESTGSFQVPAKVYVDGVTGVGAVGNVAVSVNIKKV